MGARFIVVKLKCVTYDIQLYLQGIVKWVYLCVCVEGGGDESIYNAILEEVTNSIKQTEGNHIQY